MSYVFARYLKIEPDSKTRIGFLLARLSRRAGILPFGLTASNHSLFCSFSLNEIGMTVYPLIWPVAFNSSR